MATKADNKVTTGALMLVGGGIIGAGVALLLAPQTGKEACKYISRYAKRFGRKTNEAIDEFADSITDFADTVGDKASGHSAGRRRSHPRSKEGTSDGNRKGTGTAGKAESQAGTDDRLTITPTAVL